ncbi:MAG: Rieske 2Fe-2S domain-containing protein [Planctomycetes bacterium]|nr:Rieske 2Fe-2S domain-containing protein [Planctomycetota bacterium]
MAGDPRTVQAKRALYCATVRYGKMAYVSRFKTDREGLVKQRDRCIVRTDRGRELGTVLTSLELLSEAASSDGLGDLLRRASPDDLRNAERIGRETRARQIQYAREEVKKLNLPMKVVELDHLFGGERVVVYFVSETRVDFRELVRRLAHEFRCRIELKQVGARDEARLVGDCGHCGLELCCRGLLKDLGGITMDMAKIQKHTADPSKITGRCGKLLCCLRYEYVAYGEARDLLPPRGARIQTRQGAAGVVVDQNLLLREVTIVPEGSEERVVVGFEDIVGAPKTAAGCRGCAAPKADGGAGPSEPPEPSLEETKTIPTVHVEEPPPAVDFTAVAKVEDVPEGRGRSFEIAGRQIALFKVNGTIYATEGACPHQGAPLAEGTLEGTIVTCPLHHWRFDVVTGESVSGPSRLFTLECKVENGQIFVKV